MSHLMKQRVAIDLSLPYTTECKEDASEFHNQVLEKILDPEQPMSERKVSAFHMDFIQLNTRPCAQVYMILALRAFDNWFYLRGRCMIVGRSSDSWGCDTMFYDVHSSQSKYPIELAKITREKVTPDANCCH